MAVKKKVKVNGHSAIPLETQRKMHAVWLGALEVIKRAQVARAAEPGDAKAEKVLSNLVPLKKIASNAGIDPRVARRILRAQGAKPKGRWEWDAKGAAEVEKVLKAAMGNLA